MKKRILIASALALGLGISTIAQASDDLQGRRASHGPFKSDKEMLYSLNKKVKQLESKNQDLYKRLRNLEKQLQGVLCSQESSNSLESSNCQE